MLIRSEYMHLAHRFLSKIEFPSLAENESTDLSKVDTNTCWLWKGCKTWNGYGFFRVGHKQCRAHRVSYQMFVADIQPNLLALHRCDTPACVNPTHLWLGTTRENVHDKIQKGRGAYLYGDKNWMRQNPELAKATAQHMNQAKMLRGTQARGEKVHKAKLTESEVREIHRLYAQGGTTSRRLAKQFCVGKCSILSIINRDTWKHVD